MIMVKCLSCLTLGSVSWLLCPNGNHGKKISLPRCKAISQDGDMNGRLPGHVSIFAIAKSRSFGYITELSLIYTLLGSTYNERGEDSGDLFRR